MTRSLAVALSTLGAASIASASDSRTIPQPSFVDYVVIEAPDASASSGGSAAMDRVMLRDEPSEPVPAPSFLDAGTPTWDKFQRTSATVEVTESKAGVSPTPSFLN